MADLKISIGADLSGAIAEVNKLVVSVDKLGDTGAKASSVADMLSKIPAALKPINPASMTALSDAVKRLKADLSSSTAATGLPTALATIPPAATKATAALAGIRPGANVAGQGLTDLGRILQDAPFGFIGIQNNIPPLLDSFRRLKVETGSTGGAFKALLSGIGGAGGLGLAISAVTAAVTFASIGFDRWVPKIKEAKTSTKELEDSQKSIVDSMAEETSRIAVLVSAVQDETLSKKQRNGAIAELKQINPDYFGQLDTEKSKIGQVSAAYANYTANLKQQYIAKTLNKQLDDLFKKKFDLEVNIDTRTVAAVNPAIQAQLNRYQAEINKLGGIEILPKDGDLSKLTQAQEQVLKLKAAMENTGNVRVFDVARERLELVEINKEIDGLIGRIKTAGNFDVKVPAGADKKDVDTLSEAIKQLEAYRDKVGLTSKEFEKLTSLRVQMASRDQSKNGLSTDQLQKEINAIKNSNEQLEARKKVIEGVAKAVSLLPTEKAEMLSIDIGIALNDAATGKLDLNQLQRQVDQLAQDANLRVPMTIALAGDVQAELKSKIGSLPRVALPVELLAPKTDLKAMVGRINTQLALQPIMLPSVNPDNFKKGLNKAYTDTQAGMEAIRSSIESSLEGAVSSAAEAIGSIIAGGDIGATFRNLAIVMAEGMGAIGRAMIAYGISLGALKNAVKDPVTAAIAGAGLVVAGVALKAALSQKKFAEGGIVTGPTNALIGEAGQSEVVFPLNKLNRFIGNIVGSGGGGGNFSVTHTISGSDLRLLIKRDERRPSNTFAL
jgi:hypothetical protein